MKENGITTYALVHRYGVSSSQINRWKHGEDMRLSTLNLLCSILKCEPSDILAFTPDAYAAEDLKGKRRKAFIPDGYPAADQKSKGE